jgi:alkylhydroperoxidase/carboxymuconolactone decarboxylase family protein YurZ
LNNCFFCQNIHGAVAQYYHADKPDLIQNVKKDFAKSDISDKIKALLAIAESVQKGGKYVSISQIELAKYYEATDIEIHDTVLIAVAFCMFNRYVDGLGTFAPNDAEMYKTRAVKITEETGYEGSMP